MENNNNYNNIVIGMKAPYFEAKTTFGDFKLTDYKNKWCILFSHPGDFTPVCTTEFISFAKYYPEFLKRNCELIGLSIDSTSSHLAWVYNIYKKTGIHIPFPIISDRDMSISKAYGMLPYEKNSSATIRCVYIIDPNGIIKTILYYPMTTGRYIPEILRILDALQINMNCNVATPANWIPGNPVIVPYPKTYKELLKRINNPCNYNCIDWYLCFKDINFNNKLNS